MPHLRTILLMLKVSSCFSIAILFRSFASRIVSFCVSYENVGYNSLTMHVALFCNNCCWKILMSIFLVYIKARFQIRISYNRLNVEPESHCHFRALIFCKSVFIWHLVCKTKKKAKQKQSICKCDRTLYESIDY